MPYQQKEPLFFPFSFSRSPPSPPSRLPLFASPPARPDSLMKDKAPQWGISINQTNQQERRPPISPPTSASPETPSQGCRMFLCFSGFCWPPTLALATTTAILVGNLPFSLTVSLCARNEQIEAGLCPLMCLLIWDVFKGKLGLTFSRLGRKYVMWGNNLPKTKVYTMWGQTERLILMLKPDFSECGACCIEKWSLERSEGRFTSPKRAGSLHPKDTWAPPAGLMLQFVCNSDRVSAAAFYLLSEMCVISGHLDGTAWLALFSPCEPVFVSP